MSDLKVDVDLTGLNDESSKIVELAESNGLDGVWTHETDHDSFLPLVLAAEHTEDIDMGTRIALSFTRSPMVLAYAAWDLARYSNGRFILGLGTQVKGHNERRFSVDWESPGPRLREVIEAIRHIWDVFQGEADEIDFQGDFYSFSLMTNVFDPGPIDYPDVPIYIGGINEYNVKLAGELCDGLHLHPFTTPGYAEEVIKPRIKTGAESAGRSLSDVEITASPLVITGKTDNEKDRAREEVRRRVAFYASTRTYHDVLEHHGWLGIGETLSDLSKRGDWEEMTDHVTDEMLDEFAVQAPYAEVIDEVSEAFGSTADRVLLSNTVPNLDAEDIL